MKKREGKSSYAKRKWSFVREMTRAGVSESRSRRLADRFRILAEPEVFGRVVQEIAGGKKVYAVTAAKRGGRAEVYVVKSAGSLVIRSASDTTFHPKKPQTVARAHK